MKKLLSLFSLLAILTLCFAPSFGAQISRLHSAEISNGNVVNASHLNNEYNQLVNESNSQDTRITSLESGNLTISGNKTYSGSATFNGAVTFSGSVSGLSSGVFSQLGTAVSGRRYVWPYTGFVNGNLISTANKLYFFPWIGPSGNYDDIICNLSTANTGNAIMGIYSNSGGKPGSLLKASSTFSLASGTGNKVTALTSAQALSADTLYWLAISVEGSGNYLYRADDENVGPGLTSLLGVDSTFPTNEAVNSYYGYMISYTYTGSLPASPTVTNSDAVGIDEVPLIWLEAQ